MAVIHRILPRRLAVKGFTGSRAVRQQQLDTPDIALNGGTGERAPQESGVRRVVADRAPGWRVRLQAVAQEQFEASRCVHMKGLLVGGIGAALEQQLR